VRHLRPGPSQAGLTLVELMVGLAIAAVLALTAVPFLGDYIANSRLRESGHVLLAETLAAQAEAIKRNRTIRLATSGAQIQVIDATNPASPVVLRDVVLPGGASATTLTLDFGSEGRLLPFPRAGAIDIALTGVTCSSNHRCPGLRVDAGGGIRLCPDRTAPC
jgi:type IV fimbrial biogenesis protein FimT